MAYNILKGVVEGSVDQHADQEIGGVKIFKNTISASVFFDTDAQSPCATMKDVAIVSIKGGSTNSVLICDKETGARSHHKFSAPIPACFIKHGPGLQDIRGQLQLNIGNGLICDENQVEVSIGINSGLCYKDKKIVIDPAKTKLINSMGQNLADHDVLIVSDASMGTTNGTTLANLYQNYISSRVPHAAGTKTQIQFKGDSEFASSPKLTFDSVSNLFNVEGKVRADTAYVEGALICRGSVTHNITKTTEQTYEVKPSDYTILCNTEKNKITVKVPAATNNTGRVIIIKKADSNRYKITSNNLTIASEDSLIDISDKMHVKMNYSSRTLQSDGENWWLIGSKGT